MKLNFQKLCVMKCLPYYSDCLSYSDQCEWFFFFFFFFQKNQVSSCKVMSKKPFSTHIVYTSNLHTRLQSPCETKLSKENFCKLLVIKFWIKWGVVCENLTGGCQTEPQKPFWAHLPQIYILEPSPHVRLNFQR